MYVNPIPVGVFIGAVSTLVLEVIALIILATRSNKK